MQIQLTFIQILTGSLFILGLWGIIFNRTNVIIIFISIELLLLAVTLNMVTFSIYRDDILGQFFALFIIRVAASESAIGLAVLVAYFRLRDNITTFYDEDFVSLKH